MLPRVAVSDADLSTLYRMGDGGLSPLTGPMDQATFNRVLDEEVIVHDGKKYAWTIPLPFPDRRNQATTLKPGQTVALVNGRRRDRRHTRREAMFTNGTSRTTSKASTAPIAWIIPAVAWCRTIRARIC